MTSVVDAVYGLGNALVKQVELEIGGQLIDRQYGEWMNIWSELSVPEGKRVGYDTMVGNVPRPTTNSLGTPVAPATKLDVPLMFWFNRNPGLALPLIALQYHEVKLNLDIESATNLHKDVDGDDTTANSDGGPTLKTMKLWVDYIYLDTDERRRFAQVSHEYLIEQVQFTGNETLTSGGARVDLNYNHPVKELIWVAQDGSTNGRGADLEPCRFNSMNFTTAKLQLNGHDRFTERRPEYFLNVQPFKHHTHMPRSNRDVCLVSQVAVDVTLDTTTQAALKTVAVSEDNSQYIYLYSFALNPEELQPSGTCNFSRIDNATLVLTGGTNTGVLKVYAVNYNVLRIMSGMGGLAYSN
jgi:hypothetical protein